MTPIFEEGNPKLLDESYAAATQSWQQNHSLPKHLPSI